MTERNYPDSDTHSLTDVARASKALNERTGIWRTMDGNQIDTGYNPMTGVSENPMHGGRSSLTPPPRGIDMTGVSFQPRSCFRHEL